eukprot:6203181-Pleurochrysis_carterae.AAC.2
MGPSVHQGKLKSARDSGISPTECSLVHDSLVDGFSGERSLERKVGILRLGAESLYMTAV